MIYDFYAIKYTRHVRVNAIENRVTDMVAEYKNKKCGTKEQRKLTIKSSKCMYGYEEGV